MEKEQSWKASGQLFFFSFVWTEEPANWSQATPPFITQQDNSCDLISELSLEPEKSSRAHSLVVDSLKTLHHLCLANPPEVFYSITLACLKGWLWFLKEEKQKDANPIVLQMEEAMFCVLT